MATATRTTRSRKTSKPTAPTPPADETENTVTEETVTTEEAPAKKTRKPDPLLAAKRRLEAAQKRHAKAVAKWEKVSDVETEKNEAAAELDAAKAEFQELIAQYV